MIIVKFHQRSKSKNNKIHYSIVVISTKAKPGSGKLVEKIGHYHLTPNKWNQKSIYINSDRLFFWLKRGAKMNRSLYVLIKPLLYSIS